MKEDNKKNEVEVLDLSNESSKNNKKNSKTIIIIFTIIAIFIMLLPNITSYIKNFNFFNNSTETNSSMNKNLYNGFIQIGLDSFMTVSDIKFYSFAKKTNNSIEFTYISNENISNVDDLKLSIGIYNKAQELIATYKFDISNIKKGVVKTFKINLSQINFIKATYAKVIGKDEENIKTTMNCIYDKTIDKVNLYYEIKYYFNNSKLYKYVVEKNILYTEQEQNATLEEYKQKLNEEYSSLSKTNITSIEKDDLILKYTVDIKTFNKKESDYSLLYELNTTKETILSNEESNGWVCK